MKKIFVSFILILFILFTKRANAYTLNSENDKVYLGGETVGLKLNTGVKVIKTYAIIDGINLLKPWDEAGIKEDDIIISYNGSKVLSTKDLLNALEVSKDKMVDLIVLRGNTEIKTKIKPIVKDDSYSLGIYVKDNVVGVGTLTYIIPDVNIFGALGHRIEGAKDVGGEMFEATVTGIKKGVVGEAGSKQANIKTTNIGKIEKNTVTGLHGIYSGYKDDKKLINVAKKEEVHTGYAQIVTCINKNYIEYFDIEIVTVLKQKSKDVKGIKFIVTDKELLAKSNGIVQGMSGSPIIQDDKLVGAVTHVLVNNPHEGYGIYIEFMLGDMGVNLA